MRTEKGWRLPTRRLPTDAHSVLRQPQPRGRRGGSGAACGERRLACARVVVTAFAAVVAGSRGRSWARSSSTAQLQRPGPARGTRRSPVPSERERSGERAAARPSSTARLRRRGLSEGLAQPEVSSAPPPLARARSRSRRPFPRRSSRSRRAWEPTAGPSPGEPALSASCAAETEASCLPWPRAARIRR